MLAYFYLPNAVSASFAFKDKREYKTNDRGGSLSQPPPFHFLLPLDFPSLKPSQLAERSNIEFPRDFGSSFMSINICNCQSNWKNFEIVMTFVFYSDRMQILEIDGKHVNFLPFPPRLCGRKLADFQNARLAQLAQFHQDTKKFLNYLAQRCLVKLFSSINSTARKRYSSFTMKEEDLTFAIVENALHRWTKFISFASFYLRKGDVAWKSHMSPPVPLPYLGNLELVYHHTKQKATHLALLFVVWKLSIQDSCSPAPLTEAVYLTDTVQVV